MRFAIATLGCKVNQYDSECIRQALTSSGYTEQSFTLPSNEIFIVNTCTVTHRADAENRKLIRKALCLNPFARVIATGCQTITNPFDLKKISEQVEVIESSQMGKALNIEIPSALKRFSHHARAFVKVQQGCNVFCTYCIVPYARGNPVSRPQDEVIKEINTLSAHGYNEVVLTGINIGLYEGGIASLIEKLLCHTTMPRIRISSIEPWTIDPLFLKIFAEEPRMCLHLHLPLQSGSQKILTAMARPYTKTYYQSLITSIREISSDIAIGTDIMVGFPGEDDEAFDETFQFLKTLDITYMHVFPYSKRPGTQAAQILPDVPDTIKSNRVSLLKAMSLEKKERFSRSQIGKTGDVLVIESHPEFSLGLTSNYLNVILPGNLQLGHIARVKIKEMRRGRLVGDPYG